MPRPPRVNPTEAIHHVMNHRAGDGDLFLDDGDRYWFLRQVDEVPKRYGATVLSYCLMGNHFHLVIRCEAGDLDKIMHDLQANYARWFNHRHNNRGPVFQRRYHNVLVTTDGQLQFLLRYIDRNALELGFEIRSYPWSSYPLLTGETCQAHELVEIELAPIQAMFGSIQAYVDFVEADRDNDQLRFGDGVARVLASSPSLAQDVLARLCAVVSDLAGVPATELTTSRPGRRHEPRLAATILSAELYPEHASASASWLGYSSASSYRSAIARARTRAAESSQFAAFIHSARTRIRHGSAKKTA